MIQLSPRDYQKAIFETAKDNNTLVVLPTGIGKTLIALLLAIERLKKHPLNKILFLAPTKPLVEQHFRTFQKQLPELFAQLEMFTGTISPNTRKKLFQTAEIIFSTPQCIANDLRKNLYKLNSTSLVIFDEAHRCLKNYDYTKVASHYKNQSENQRILGLTASPGQDPEKVRQICRHLNIKKIESRTRTSKDVKPYLKELEFNKILIDFPKEFIEIRTLLRSLWDSLVLKLKEKNLLYGPANKITLLKLQNNLAKRISRNDYTAIHGISLTAQAIKLSHALELLETQTLSSLKDYMKNLFKQARENKSKAVKLLIKSPEFNAAFISLNNLLGRKVEHPKIDALIRIVKKEIKQNPKAKIMIFAQYRDTISLINSKLNKIPKINPTIFIGQGTKQNISSIPGMNQKQQKQTIENFSKGKLNVLCSTSIGEEGLDIPEVNAVIFYEPIPSAIRKIQRAGRTARLSPGKLIILITKGTRDEINYYISGARERKMYKTLSLINEEMKNKKTKTLYDFK